MIEIGYPVLVEDIFAAGHLFPCDWAYCASSAHYQITAVRKKAKKK